MQNNRKYIARELNHAGRSTPVKIQVEFMSPDVKISRYFHTLTESKSEAAEQLVNSYIRTR